MGWVKGVEVGDCGGGWGSQDWAGWLVAAMVGEEALGYGDKLG